MGELDRAVSEWMVEFGQEFELIPVDDGSFVDTPARLAELARAVRLCAKT